jgi:glycosyltransferase involved in cell wall biosynthesis
MISDATIVIVARNAEATVARAVRSAIEQGGYPVLLVDDGSTDATVKQAKLASGGNLIVQRIKQHRTLGYARQLALESVCSDYTVLLDSDDELLPGRVERLTAAMCAENTQFAADGIELCDGASGRMLRQIPVPMFLRSQRVLARLFERNYLPGVGQVAFRTEFARRVGYDPEMHGPEDMDLVLRAVMAGAEFSLLGTCGYRMYAYPQSVSRQLENQRRMTRRFLLKHSYPDVESLYRRTGYSTRITRWGLVSMAVFREDYNRALAWLQDLEYESFPADEVLEPEGPCPFPEGWRLNFQHGTIDLFLGNSSHARELLRLAERRRVTAEGANNLGVAEYRCGEHALAKELFALAQERFPGYSDARLNLGTMPPCHITTHPLRGLPARNDYLPCKT